MKIKEVPIIFVHYGKSWYLEYTLRQAKFYAKKIYLLNDGQYIIKDKNINIRSFSNFKDDLIEEFKSLYVHLSTNPFNYELFCFLRWLYILHFVKKEDIKWFLTIDSDVLLYEKPEIILTHYHDLDGDCGIIQYEQEFESYAWCASGGISLWSIHALEKFCIFMLNIYREKTKNIYQLFLKKWDWHKKNLEPGGICDMTALYFFLNEYNELKVVNLADIYKNKVFDSNIAISTNNSLNEFVYKGDKKLVHFVNNKPYFFKNSNRKKELIQVFALHFQGNHKLYIPRFYTGENFEGKSTLDLKINYELIKFKIKRSLKKTFFYKLYFRMYWIKRYKRKYS